MNDETVIIRRTQPVFAYLFWTEGVRRGEYAQLVPEGVTLGRGAEADIILDDDTVSAEQARIRREGTTWVLYDLASANRTVRAGQPVARAELTDGDHLAFGNTPMVFRCLDEGAVS